MNRASRLITLLAVSMLMVACGSSSAASTSSSNSSEDKHITSVSACSLVTAAEASTIAGSTLTDLTASLPQQIPGFCFYGAQDSSAGVAVYAQIYSDRATADQVTAAEFSAALQAQIGNDANNAKEVQGVGDRAFEFTDSGNAGAGIAIIVFKYNVIFMIAVDPSSSPSAIESLARTAVGRIK